MNLPFDVLDLGRMAFGPCYELQLRHVEEVLGGGRDRLLLVEHDPVLTLGANFHESNLLLPRDEYAALGIEVVPTDRGGDVTYHGPGQLVAYPVFSLDRRGRDLHRWLRDLEEVVIQALEGYGVAGRRFPPHTGVWVEDLKMCAIGIKVRRWVSFHGLALNCDNELSPFDLIVPCGIEGYGVTSLSLETAHTVSVGELKPRLIEAFATVLG
ncbi:MAG: hypothetical protein AMXMBFR81_29600 [Chthonomonas sp.]